MDSFGKVEGRKARVRRARLSTPHAVDAVVPDSAPLVADPYRHVVFPNNIRDIRMAKGQLKLLPFSSRLPEIPYIRLSKIERGEVFARADELVRIAAALDVAPASLLIDIAAPGFDMATWFAPFAEGAVADDPEEAKTALLLAAAVRRARAADPHLSAAAINDEFGIAPVILSRIENAQKGLSRWSQDIVAAVGRLLGDREPQALRHWLDTLHADGELDRFLDEIVGADDRERRTRQRISALAIELDQVALPGRNAAAPAPAVPTEPARRIALLGVPDADGTIVLDATGETILAPPETGARAFAIRIARATLGPGLPAGTTVIADPDRHPRAGGLALVREGERHRLVSVSADRTGALVGHSLYPEREIAIDALEVGDVVMVVAAFFA